MTDFLDAYSIQYWLESCPQSYLMNTENGHSPGESEPDAITRQFRSRAFQAELEHARETFEPASDATWQGANLSTLDPSEMEGLLSETVLGEFQSRLQRIGIEYQTPARP